jgi:hypothetical protein
MTTPVCTDCGANGWVACPAHGDKPALILCCECFAKRWGGAAERAREADLDAAYVHQPALGSEGGA